MYQVAIRRALVVVVLAIGSCHRPQPVGEPQPPPEARCPDVATLEAMHATQYEVENGLLDAARQSLAVVRAARTEAPVGDPRWDLFDALAAALDEPGGATGGARLAAEEIRAMLSDWPCMTDAMHEGFHERLDSSRSTPRPAGAVGE